MKQEQIERAAKLIKIVHLAGLPGMDHVAVKLNCGPTYDEIRHAEHWAKAFELAARDGTDIWTLAKELAAAR